MGYVPNCKGPKAYFDMINNIQIVGVDLIKIKNVFIGFLTKIRGFIFKRFQTISRARNVDSM